MGAVGMDVDAVLVKEVKQKEGPAQRTGRDFGVAAAKPTDDGFHLIKEVPRLVDDVIDLDVGRHLEGIGECASPQGPDRVEPGVACKIRGAQS